MTKIPRRELLTAGMISALFPMFSETSYSEPTVSVASSSVGVNGSASVAEGCPPSFSPEPSRDTLVGIDADLETIDVSDGNVPFPRQADAWKLIVEEFAKQYSLFEDANLQNIPESSYLAAPLHAAALCVDSGLSYSQSPNPQKFRPNQVDLLLNQSADIIDRCIRDRVEWEEKQAKWASLALEILDFLQQDTIHSREIEAGVYTVPLAEAELERKAREFEYKAHVNSNGVLCGLFGNYYSWSNGSNISGFQQLQAIIGVYNSRESLLKWNGVQKKLDEYAKIAADNLSEFNFNSQRLIHLAAYTRTDCEKGAASCREMAAAERQRWLKRDIELQRQRTAQARRLVDLRVRLSVEAGGPFNYREKMDIVSKRIGRDFCDVLARLRAAEVGLKTIFGYDNPLPQSVNTLLDRSASTDARKYTGVLDDCNEWLRNSIAWLVRFSGFDQSYSLTVSLRQQLGSEAWKSGLDVGRWNLDVKDEAGGELAGLKCIRLSSVSASVAGENVGGLWKVSFRVPQKAGVTYSNGEGAIVDQQDIPIARLGRVGTRELIREPDSTGRTSLRNASPIGRWEIILGSTSTRGEQRKQVEDLELNLELVYQ